MYYRKCYIADATEFGELSPNKGQVFTVPPSKLTDVLLDMGIDANRDIATATRMTDAWFSMYDVDETPNNCTLETPAPSARVTVCRSVDDIVLAGNDNGISRRDGRTLKSSSYTILTAPSTVTTHERPTTLKQCKSDDKIEARWRPLSREFIADVPVCEATELNTIKLEINTRDGSLTNRYIRL